MGPAVLRGSAWARIAFGGMLCGPLAFSGGSPTDSGPSGDPSGDEPPSFEQLFGNTLVKADGSQVDLRGVREKSLVGIYFASGSCPACGAFTPHLVSTYRELRIAGKSFEIVMASLDADAAAMLAYMNLHSMEWLAIPYDRDRVLSLAQFYGVEWIPTLVVLDAQARTVTKTGREDVLARGAGAYDLWLAASGTE